MCIILVFCPTFLVSCSDGEIEVGVKDTIICSLGGEIVTERNNIAIKKEEQLDKKDEKTEKENFGDNILN